MSLDFGAIDAFMTADEMKEWDKDNGCVDNCSSATLLFHKFSLPGFNYCLSTEMIGIDMVFIVRKTVSTVG